MSQDAFSSGVKSRRQAQRNRTRMRPVKLLTTEAVFVADGAAIDVSEKGARVLRHGGPPLEARLQLFDETDHSIRTAVLIWERAGVVGLRFTGPARRVSRADIQRLAGRYYAVVD